MTPAHTRIKSLPNREIVVEATENREPKRINFELSGEYSRACHDWQKSFITYPTLPDQRNEILLRRFGLGYTHEDLSSPVDCLPAMFKFEMINHYQVCAVERLNAKSLIRVTRNRWRRFII